MTTATVDTESTVRRAPAQRTTRPAGNRQPKLVEAGRSAETAVIDLVSATNETLRAFVPSALLRPTEAVDYTFDIAEQLLSLVRRFCYEIAATVEGGLEGMAPRTS